MARPLPWKRDPDNLLTTAQRIDYFVGGIQWLNDLVYLGFSFVLLISAGLLLSGARLTIRPLLGAAVLLPSALIASGLLRALWALRIRTHIGTKRAVLAFCNWMSLSWTVALACLLGLTRSEGVFLRTPKTDDRSRLLGALWVARTETAFAILVWGLAVGIGVTGSGAGFILALFAWQGFVYACAPFMSWLNLHTKLSAQLERRRRTETRREQRAVRRLYYVGAALGLAGIAAVAAIVGVGGSRPYVNPKSPFVLKHRSPTDRGPFTDLVSSHIKRPTSTTSTAVPSSTVPGTAPAPPASATTVAPTTTSPPRTTAPPTTKAGGPPTS